MSVVRELTTSATPAEVLHAVDGQIGHTERVHTEEHRTSAGTMTIAVYEQYFARVKNRIALMILADDFKGPTGVRIIATGASQGMIFNLDWGAAGAYASEAEHIISQLS